MVTKSPEQRYPTTEDLGLHPNTGGIIDKLRNSFDGIVPENYVHYIKLLSEQNILLSAEPYKVDSSSWNETVEIKGLLFKINPEKDIIECIGGEQNTSMSIKDKFTGRQFFNWHGMKRISEELGIRIPTRDELSNIYYNIEYSQENLLRLFGIEKKLNNLTFPDIWTSDEALVDGENNAIGFNTETFAPGVYSKNDFLTFYPMLGAKNNIKK